MPEISTFHWYYFGGGLQFYCLKDLSILTFPYGIPEVFSITVTGLIHFLKRNAVLSVFAGTVSYI